MFLIDMHVEGTFHSMVDILLASSLFKSRENPFCFPSSKFRVSICSCHPYCGRIPECGAMGHLPYMHFSLLSTQPSDVFPHLTGLKNLGDCLGHSFENVEPQFDSQACFLHLSPSCTRCCEARKAPQNACGLLFPS